MKNKIKLGISVVIILISALSCNPPEGDIIQNDSALYSEEEIKEVEGEFIGEDPFLGIKSSDYSKNNYDFHEISLFLEKESFNLDEEENVLTIHPNLFDSGNYNITICFISPQYYYEAEGKDSYMAALELKNEYRSRLGDNQIYLNSLFKTAFFNKGVLVKDSYGVYYYVEETSTTLLLYLVHNKNIYTFELTDLNNPRNIIGEESFLTLKNILKSVEFK